MGEASLPPVVGRFAPSPTGRMHAGNIFSALVCWLAVRLQDGRIVLRIEDLDAQRSRPEYAEQIMVDLEALGLSWDEGPYFQSDRSERYREALHALDEAGALYPCFCTRADLRSASAPHEGENQVYRGTCRYLSIEERAMRLQGRRRDRSNAAAVAYEPTLRVGCDERTIVIDDLFQGRVAYDLTRQCGDFVVRRSDGGASYQLAVVVDDDEQGVNLVVRGCDLLSSTPQQMHLQQLLGLATPHYGHIPLLVDEAGVRLAKRHQSASLEELYGRYRMPEAIIGHICALCGLIDEEEPLAPEELLERFTLESLVDRLAGERRILFTA